MAKKVKGNIFYEILIVVLAVVLIGTIYYPSKTWKREEEIELVCRTRMEFIHQLETLYKSKITDNYDQDYNKVVKAVQDYPAVIAELDTTVYWDGLVTRESMEKMIMRKHFPKDLVDQIFKKLKNREPLVNLGVWDSLNSKLIAALRKAMSDSVDATLIDKSVEWPLLIGESRFREILKDNSDIPERIRRRTISEIDRGQRYTETRDWADFRPLFVSEMKIVLDKAERTDLFYQKDRKRWEKEKKEQWDSNMAKYSQTDTDTLLKIWDELHIEEKEKNKQFESDMAGLTQAEKDSAIKIWYELYDGKMPQSYLMGLTQAEKDGIIKVWYESYSRSKNIEEQFESFMAKVSPAERDNVIKEVYEAHKAHRDAIWQAVVYRRFWDRDKELVWKKDRDKLWESEGERWKNVNKEILKLKITQLWEMERKQLWRGEEVEKLSSIAQRLIWEKEYVNRLLSEEYKDEWKAEEIEKLTTNEKKQNFEANQDSLWRVKEKEDKELFDAKPDSLWGIKVKEAKQLFAANQDSLWRLVLGDLKKKEFEQWNKDSKDYIEDVIRGFWKAERQVSWMESVKFEWINDMISDKKKLWGNLIEEKWKMEKDDLWGKEEEKLASQKSACWRLDLAVKWIDILGEEKVENIVKNLQLPDNRGVWEEVKKGKREDGSKLYQLGLTGLFKEALFDSLNSCPVAGVPYLITATIDTTQAADGTMDIKKYLEVHCPILVVDETNKKYAISIDSLSQDTTRVGSLNVPVVDRIIGGGTIKKHGYIDRNRIKSWEKRGQ